MGKRFTDTEKWDDKWFRPLMSLHKLAWNYLCDNCDIAGFIDLDRGLADFRIGETLDWDAFIEAAGSRIAKLTRGKLWLPGFILFQYGELSEDCRPHQAVLRILVKYAQTEPIIKEYLKGIHTPKDKDKDKDQDKDKSGNRKKQINASSVPVPEGWDTPPIRQAISDWLDYKSKKGQPYKDAGYLGRKVAEYERAGPESFIAAVDSSIGNGYAGLFPAKNFNGQRRDNSASRPGGRARGL